MRQDCVMIYDGTKWELKDGKDTLEELYTGKKEHLEDKYEELIDKLSDVAKKKFKRFINTDDDDDISATLKKELKLLLYNNKKLPLDTKKKLGVLTKSNK